MSYVLGLDAGNTKTIALISRLDGTVVGTGFGGCGDIYGASSESAALHTVESVVAQALREASASSDDLAVGLFSMAGADWPEDFAFLTAALEERGLGRKVIVVNDAMGALRAASPDGTGVVVVCGTAIAIAARAPDGTIWHHSWWQESGGARHLGARALRAVYRAELGIDSPTELTGRVLSFLEKRSVEDVLHMFTARGRQPVVDVGWLAQVVLDAAEDTDATAQAMVREHGEMLGEYALAAARKVGIEGTLFTLALAGGVFRHPGTFHTNALAGYVRARAPSARIVTSRFEPAVGAVLLALEAAGVMVDEALLTRLALFSSH